MRRHCIFISYRRDDAAGYARAIADHLAVHFGPERVFIDVDDIAPGEAFAALIDRELAHTGALLVLIGPRWAGEQADGTTRLDDEADFVRREVAQGLASGAPVIPVLLDGTTMPAAQRLPPALQHLPSLNALSIDASRFAVDMQRLVQLLRDRLDGPEPGLADPGGAGGPAASASTAAAHPADGGPSPRGIRRLEPTRRLRPVHWTALAAALVVAGLTTWWPAGPSHRLSTEHSSARPAINGQWQAQVHYSWLPEPLTERFVFSGEAGDLQGSASFLRVSHAILSGSATASGLRFETRSREVSGETERELRHVYQGRLSGDTLALTLQTEGGISAAAPLNLLARRLPDSAAGASGPR